MSHAAMLLVAFASFAGIAWLAHHAIVVAPKDLRLTELDVTLPDIGEELTGYTLAVIADLHHRPFASYDYLDRVIAAVRAARPDVILLLGDYGISFKYARRGNVRMYRHATAALARLVSQTRAPDGVLAVLGNHDYYTGASRVTASLRALGVQVLDNTCVEIQRGRATLLIGGVGDAREGIVDPAGGCGDCPASLPRIILSHNPDGILALHPTTRADLIVSGHTHGGQIVFPMLGAPMTMCRLCTRRSPSGWVPNARAPLYVSRGVGCQVPIRFRCPPELVILRLRAAQHPV